MKPELFFYCFPSNPLAELLLGSESAETTASDPGSWCGGPGNLKIGDPFIMRLWGMPQFLCQKSHSLDQQPRGQGTHGRGQEGPSCPGPV